MNNNLITTLDQEDAFGNTRFFYPNPTEGIITFINGERGRLKLYDMFGKLIISEEILPGVQMSIENLPKGLYLYHITTANGKYTGKIILR